MRNTPKHSQNPLYEEVATKLIHMLDSGALAVGSRAPSVRALSAQLKVSISTVVAAYCVVTAPAGGVWSCSFTPVVGGGAEVPFAPSPWARAAAPAPQAPQAIGAPMGSRATVRVPLEVTMVAV